MAKEPFGMMYGWVLRQPGLTLVDVKTYWALTLNAYSGVVKGKSLKDLAGQAGHPDRKVRDSIKKLEAIGAITVERTYSALGNSTNLYTIVSGGGTTQSVPKDSTVPTPGTHGSGGTDSAVRRVGTPGCEQLLQNRTRQTRTQSHRQTKKVRVRASRTGPGARN